jgi:hypothetical protein
MADPKAPLAALTRLDLYFSIRHFNRTARRFGELFGNDYDRVVIFMIVAEACFQSILHLGGAEANRAEIEKIYLESSTLGLNQFAISEASGIPRETVRRKIKQLIDGGFLAILPSSKNIFVPVAALLEPAVAGTFERYAADIDHFVRTAKYYTRPGG